MVDNNIQLILEWKNKDSRDAGRNLAKVIARGRQRSSTLSDITDTLNTDNSRSWYAKSKAAGEERSAAGTVAQGVQKAHDSATAANGARYLSRGQDSVGKGRKTLMGKAKQFGRNYNTVYKKIHNAPLIEK